MFHRLAQFLLLLFKISFLLLLMALGLPLHLCHPVVQLSSAKLPTKIQNYLNLLYDANEECDKVHEKSSGCDHEGGVLPHYIN